MRGAEPLVLLLEAASLLGRPRVTGDVDAVVWIGDASWYAFVEAGRRFGIVPRRPDVIAFARCSRVLLLRHEPSTIDLDVSLGALPFEEEMIARARRHRLGRLSVPLPAPEDLIIMKAIAHRPRTLALAPPALSPTTARARSRSAARFARGDEPLGSRSWATAAPVDNSEDLLSIATSSCGERHSFS